MDDTHGNKKHEYDKVALLGLFALSLLLAYFVVFFRSKIVFSDPIELSQAGLSVSIPSGQGWQSDEQWNYQDNMFSLNSLFPRGSDRPTAWASCRYLLSTDKVTPQMRFMQRASAIDAVIIETSQTQTDTLTIDWARIDIPELQIRFFFGTSKLPGNRQLDIEVGQIAGDVELTLQIFKSIIESLKFENNQLLEAGAEIIAEMKSRGIGEFLSNQNGKAYFLIKDEVNNTIGFTMDVIVDSGANSPAAGDQPDIHAAGQFYIRGQDFVEHAATFQCSNNLDEFVYKSETNRRAGRTRAVIVLNKTDVITIKTFQAQPDERSCRLGPSMIPDVFLDQLLTQMLDSENDRIVIDIIEATGKIIPTLLTAIETTEDKTADEDAAYIFGVELLDGRGYSEKYFLNDQKQVYKRLASQDALYILEHTTAENIAREFPEHAESILRNNRSLK